MGNANPHIRTKHNRLKSKIEDHWDLVAAVLCIGKLTNLSIKNPENQLEPRSPGIWERGYFAWKHMRNCTSRVYKIK